MPEVLQYVSLCGIAKPPCRVAVSQVKAGRRFSPRKPVILEQPDQEQAEQSKRSRRADLPAETQTQTKERPGKEQQPVSRSRRSIHAGMSQETEEKPEEDKQPSRKRSKRSTRTDTPAQESAQEPEADQLQQRRPLANLGKRTSRADAPEEALAKASHLQPSAARSGKRARSTEAGQESTAGPAGVVAVAPSKHGRRVSKAEAAERLPEAAQAKPAKKGKVAAALEVGQGSSKE